MKSKLSEARRCEEEAETTSIECLTFGLSIDWLWLIIWWIWIINCRGCMIHNSLLSFALPFPSQKSFSLNGCRDLSSLQMHPQMNLSTEWRRIKGKGEWGEGLNAASLKTQQVLFVVRVEASKLLLRKTSFYQKRTFMTLPFMQIEVPPSTRLKLSMKKQISTSTWVKNNFRKTTLREWDESLRKRGT